MSSAPVPGELESLVARAMKAHSSRTTPAEDLQRQEPHLAQPQPSRDPDIQDVVQRFERAYSEVQARGADGSLERGLQYADTPTSGPAETSPPPDAADPPNDTRIVLAEDSPQAAPAMPKLPLERYELPDIAPLPFTFERNVSPTAMEAREQASRRVWPFAVGAAALALLVGIGVGYSLVPRQAHTRLIEQSSDGGTRLRLDYDLPNR
jgi:hypothetical protein